MSYNSDVVFTFNWKIVNFSFNSLKSGEKFESPVFYVDNLKSTTWYMRLYPKGYNKEYDDHISCFLYYNNYDDEAKKVVLVSFTLELTDSQSNIWQFSKYPNRSVTQKGCGNYKFLTVNELTYHMQNSKEDTLWIRCHFIEKNYEKLATFCDASTVIPVKKCSFKWKIQIADTQNWTEVILFPFQDIQFEINLSVKDECIHFEIKNTSLLDLHTTYKVDFSCSNERVASIKMENPAHFFESTCKNRYLKFKSSVKIVNELRLIYAQPFTLICIISSSSGMATSSAIDRYCFGSVVGEVSKNVVTCSSSLQEDLKKMLLDKKHCDLKLKAQGEIVPAHKSIICARSPVFSAMFDLDMLENQTGIVDIPDVESETLKCFLEFLYTDTLKNTETEHVLKLMLLAEKYKVEMLKEQCSEILMAKLSMENVCEIISVAEMMHQEKLKQTALDYIKTNKKEILLTPDWPEWVGKNMKLAVEILSHLALD